MNLDDAITTLETGLPRLHDDAFSPIKPAGQAAGFEHNTFTDPYLQGLHDPHVALPGLRHGTRPTPPTPQGNRQARHIWDHTLSLISQDTGPIPTCESPHRIIRRVRQTRHDTGGAGVIAAARIVTPWTATRIGGRQCHNQGKGRCQGSPVVAKGLCRTCYDRQRFYKIHQSHRRWLS